MVALFLKHTEKYTDCESIIYGELFLYKIPGLYVCDSLTINCKLPLLNF